jgi:hypothetical protein
MLNSPHTSASKLMQGNALVLKTPVENAPRTSIEKYLSWSPDIPPASRFPLHQSRPAEYQPNKQQPLSAERGGRGTTLSLTTTRVANELSTPKSAYAGDAVLSTSTWGTVRMGQFAGCYRGQHLTVSISTNDLHC